MTARKGLRELEARWKASAATPATGLISLLVVRLGDGEHSTPSRIDLSPEEGVHGDRWRRSDARDPEAQVSFIDRRVVEVLVGADVARMHVPGDNVVVDLDLDEASLPVGARCRLGSAVIEITAKPHAGCAKFRARLGTEALRWVNARPHRGRRLRGVYGRVVVAGSVAIGDLMIRDSAAASG